MFLSFLPAGSGSIDPDELRTVLKSCLRESAISLPEEKLDDLTLALFESADKDNSGSITFEELKAELENFPEVMENLTIRSEKPVGGGQHCGSSLLFDFQRIIQRHFIADLDLLRGEELYYYYYRQ